MVPSRGVNQGEKKDLEKFDTNHRKDPDVQHQLSMLVKEYFPEEFSRLSTVAKRAGWTTKNFSEDTYEAGIFLNRVTLWKLDARLHVDANDAFCAISCGGNFTGGELLLPDLHLKFK